MTTTVPVDDFESLPNAVATTAGLQLWLDGSDPLAEVSAALAAREPLYRECADVAFDTAALATDEVVDRIVVWLRERPTGSAERGAPA